jgi:hypothetical protein
VKNQKMSDEKTKTELNYKSLIEKVSENGDLVILGQKGTCKTTFLMHLARELRTDAQKHVIIFETFPKWIHEFDAIPYLVIKDSDVQPKENLPYMQEDFSYIQWSKDYTILNADSVAKALRENKDLIFLILCEDMERISAFMTFVIYQIYRKQYARAYYGRLENIKESFWFLAEEAHNLLDSCTVQKKTFQKLRKEQNEFRNLNMHLIAVALRLQDLNPKIRSKMSILLSRVSLDDYQLKVRNLLRNNKYRNVITELPKGNFVLPETDLMLNVSPFKQQGNPTEIKPQVQSQQPKPQEPLFNKIAKHFLFPRQKALYEQVLKLRNQQQQQAQQSSSEGLDSEEETENEDIEMDDLLLGEVDE